MHKNIAFTSVLVAALLSSAVTAAPVPAMGKRFFDSSKDGKTSTSTQTNTDTSTYHGDTTTTNTQNTKDAGNQNLTGNNGGGNFNGPTTNGGTACKRAYYNLRRELHEEYARGADWQANLNAKMDALKNGGNVTKTTTNTNTNNYNQQSWDDHSTNNSGNTYVNNSKNQDIKNSNGSTMNSAGAACRRELDMLDQERRELATGDGVLSAFAGTGSGAGLAARSGVPTFDALAVRDLGALAESIGIRSFDGYDVQLGRRATGIQCDTAECAALMSASQNSARDLLQEHARSLGFEL